MWDEGGNGWWVPPQLGCAARVVAGRVGVKTCLGRARISCQGLQCCVLCYVCVSARHLVPGLAVLCTVLCVCVRPASRARACSVVCCAVCACPPGISCQGLQCVCVPLFSIHHQLRHLHEAQEAISRSSFQHLKNCAMAGQRTQVCKFWLRNCCERGPLCDFAHEWRGGQMQPRARSSRNPHGSERPPEELMQVGEF